MTRKATSLKDIRLAGLDRCDALVTDLIARGLVAVTPEVVRRLEEEERAIQSYKLMRFSREIAALRFRFAAGLRSGEVDARVMAGRLDRLRTASLHLRALLADPASVPGEAEDLAGRTWRDSDLEHRENFSLAEMAWESVRLEEGFRIDTSYLGGPGGEVFCERKIIPVGIRGVDESPKPRRSGIHRYPLVGIYPGDRPRRIKILQLPGPDNGTEVIDPILAGASVSVEQARGAFLDRWRRPFPPDTFPALISRPLLRCDGGRWRVLDRTGAVVETAPLPGTGRQPDARACLEAFERAALTAPLDALLLLLHDLDGVLVASPAGAILDARPLRFGIDVE